MTQMLTRLRLGRGVRAVAAGVVAAALVGLPAVSLAQPIGNRPAAKKELTPPIPPAPTEPPSAPLQMSVAVAILAILVGVSMIPSKRGHQD
ncbi:MAG: hypothetical protein KF745_12215 [Phycisphaeraceae bacterium]|nr:hypothetical protein [Phycisphaeraceae bacterium]